jgi:DNA-binding NarL/FixJ family response regulator
MTARIVLVDDHPVIRDGLGSLLAAHADIEIVGEAGDETSALAVLERTMPDVVVLDLSLHGREALPLLEEIRSRWPVLRILVLSMHDELLYAERLLALGVHGYIMKQEAPTEFLRALRKVAAGEVYASAAVSERLLARIRQGHQPHARRSLEQLTDRERHVLLAIARGLGTREIAATLGMSPKTVDSHRRNMREKLGLGNARGLVLYAVRWAVEKGDDGSRRA